MPAGAVTTPKPTGANATTAASCRLVRDDAWPDWVDGQPAGFDAGDNGGVYLWHDSSGFHLRVTHKTDDKVDFSGVLRTTGRFTDVAGVALENNDHFTVGPDQHELAFRFVSSGHVDGIDFHTQCAPNITADFHTNGHVLPADRVVIGHLDHHPTTDPFTITRTL